MEFLAISGSGRLVSTNTSMLRAMAAAATPEHTITVFDRIAGLPVFSPDSEIGTLPEPVQIFVNLIRDSDGLIIASPEYVRAIPGGLKNAIDWLVSRDEIIGKPIVLAHASHRGDDMLSQLRLVLSTVSERFTESIFLRYDLMKRSPQEISDFLGLTENRSALTQYLRNFSEYCHNNRR